MKCLSCAGDLSSVKHQDTRTEQCSQCGGIWLDQEELEHLKDADTDIRWMELDLWKEAREVSGSISPRRCPYGHGPLVTLAYGDSGLLVDVCRRCGGIWLDTGELEKILAYLENKALSATVPDYIRESLKEAGDLVSGGEGRISEWKDLRAVLKMMRIRLAVEHPSIAAVLRALPR